MTERKQDFTIEAGDPHTIRDTVTINGSTKDISGYDAQVTVAQYEGGTVVEQFDHTDSRFSITDGPNGECEITLEETDTEGLAKHDVQTYYYEIELTDSGGTDHTVTTGTITVRPSY